MAINFTIRSAKQFATKLNCRMRSSGKLGFGQSECTLMDLHDGVYVSFVSCEENVPITHIVIKREKDDDSFPLKKGNTTHPEVETKVLFDFYRYDYVNKTIFFDLVREDEFDEMLGGEVYRATLRIKEKSGKAEDQPEEDEIDD